MFKDRSEKGQSRSENLGELVEAARGFRYEVEEGEELPPLEAFLANAALESGEGQASQMGRLRANDDLACG